MRHGRGLQRPDLSGAASAQINADDDVYYDTPQGSSHLPGWYQLNFAFEATFKMFERLELALKADIFNITNQQPAIDNTKISPAARRGVFLRTKQRLKPNRSRRSG